MTDTAVFGLLIVAVLLLTALFAPLIAPSDPQAQDYALTLRPPGEGGLMGTDSLGSDVFSRVVYGARISLGSSSISVGIALLVGVPVGLTSGYFGGFWDEWIVMRVVDSLQTFPFLILALVIAAILGGGMGYAMIAIGIGFIPAFVRIRRAQVLTVRGLDYVDAARSIGTSHARIMLRHVLPILFRRSWSRRLSRWVTRSLRKPPSLTSAWGPNQGSRVGDRCSSRHSPTSRRPGGWRSSQAWRSSSPSSDSISSATVSAKPSTHEPTTRGCYEL
jgi:ABC-type antimicrobial peptide transport system permease subunit